MKPFKPLLLAAGLVVCAVSCKFLAQKIVETIRHLDRWADGTLKKEGDLVDGLQSGDWTYYYQDGRRRASGPYQDDHQVGEWTYWYESGVIEWTGSFNDSGKRTGFWTFFHDNENVRAQGRYVGDFEDGDWTFFYKSGALHKRGQFQDGKLSGLWTYWHDSGAKKAQGLHHRGKRVGNWRFWEESGEESTKDFGLADNVEIAWETWDDGSPRRTGIVVDGAPVGRWASYHDNEELRLAYGLVDGRVGGAFSARDAEGQPVAEGVIDGGEFGLGCRQWKDGEEAELVSGPMPHRPPGTEGWSEPSIVAEASPAVVVATWVAEAELPLPTVETAQPIAKAAAAASPEQLAWLEQPKRVPAPQQPGWTVLQTQELQDYVKNYRDGRSRKRVSRRRYGVAGEKERITGPRRRTELEGKKLPVRRFESVDGTVVNIEDFEGKKRVLIVVLRGFAGEVCVYCVAQTEALAQMREEFDKLNLEVLVVYPGPEGNEEAFLAAYEATFGHGAPPYKVFYDPDLALVSKLGIQGGDLAYPTTLILDKQGVVEHAYVGAHRADRPAAKALIKAIKEMKD